jgi:pimeloyl-ACP methyl ester carboxylesterase
MRIVATFRSLGVPARHIFLVGQSAGAWSSLLVQRQAADTINAVIALAPAFAGPRSEESVYPWWRREILPKQMEFMTQARVLNALIFAFPDDDYDRPQELAPLASISGVTLVAFQDCQGGHLTAFTACFRGKARETIEAYIRSRIP